MGDYDWTFPHDEYDYTAAYRDRSNTTGGLAESWEVNGVSTIFHIRKGVQWHDKPPVTGANYSGAYRDRSNTTGGLAESWEVNGVSTIFHIRKGVQWHDKPPVNGRELTAYDVEYTFHRQMGLGDFAEVGPTPHVGDFNSLAGSTVTATDEFTLEVISPSFDMRTIDTLTWFNWASGYIVPPEPVNEYGDMRDWRNLVGTGPYIITNVVPGSKVTYAKHPNYWMEDPIYPDENLKLPYADQVVHFIIPDIAARVAALRTGKVEYLAGPGLLNIDQVTAIERTNRQASSTSTIAFAKAMASRDTGQSLTWGDFFDMLVGLYAQPPQPLVAHMAQESRRLQTEPAQQQCRRGWSTRLVAEVMASER